MFRYKKLQAVILFATLSLNSVSVIAQSNSYEENQAKKEAVDLTIEWLQKKQAEDSVASEKALKECQEILGVPNTMNDLLTCMYNRLGS